MGKNFTFKISTTNVLSFHTGLKMFLSQLFETSSNQIQDDCIVKKINKTRKFISLNIKYLVFVLFFFFFKSIEVKKDFKSLHSAFIFMFYTTSQLFWN